jgi:hypothetical protein
MDGPEIGPADIGATAYFLYLMFGPKGSADPNQPISIPEISPAVFDAANAVGDLAWAMRMKAMADAQGGGGSLSDPCPGLRFRGRIWKVSEHFQDRLDRPGVSLDLEDVQEILDRYGPQARFLKPGRSPNSEVYDIGGYNMIINPVNRVFITIW